MFLVVTFQRSAEPTPLRRLFGGGTQLSGGVYGGSEYAHLCQTFSARGEPRWGEIARRAGRLGVKLVLPPGVSPPPGYGLRRCPLEPFYGELALSAAFRLLDGMGEKAARAEVGLIDPEGVFCRQGIALAQHCAALWVYTRRRERYLAAARDALLSSGAAVLLAEEPAALSGCAFCVAPGAGAGLSLRCPVIAGQSGTVRGRPTADRLTLLLPPGAAEAAPQGIAPEDFFGALALYGARGLAFPAQAGACRIDGRLADISELLYLL